MKINNANHSSMPYSKTNIQPIERIKIFGLFKFCYFEEVRTRMFVLQKKGISSNSKINKFIQYVEKKLEINPQPVTRNP